MARSRPPAAEQVDLFSALPASKPREVATQSKNEARPPPPDPAPRPAPVPEAPTVLTVGGLTLRIKGTLERNFARVIVRGEVSGFRGANARGHLYFALKDSEASIDAKIWASSAQKMKFRLRDGLAVVAEGYVDLYAPQGRYSLIVQKLEPEGEGALALAFAQLKERLIQEGLMGEGRKRPQRPLPFLPRRIGVVTSRTGAALQDFLRVLHNRHPGLSVLIADARVQGEGSAAEVVRALRHLSATDVDVIVVTRGGGSVEDLWTFNEETVARAIFDCPVPVVSAIGHEVDFTIADFVADFRAPTPSAAAERLAPVLSELQLSLSMHKQRLRKAIERQVISERRQLEKLSALLSDPRRLLDGKRLYLSNQADALASALRSQIKNRSASLRWLSERLARQSPHTRLAQSRERLKFSHAALVSKIQKRLTAERQKTAQLAAVLHHLSPLTVMARGYSTAFGSTGRLLRRAADVAVGEEITLRLLPPNAGGNPTVGDTEEIRAKVTSVSVPETSPDAPSLPESAT